MWPGLKVLHGKPSHSQSQGSVERTHQDVHNMMMKWIQTHQGEISHFQTNVCRAMRIIFEHNQYFKTHHSIHLDQWFLTF